MTAHEPSPYEQFRLERIKRNEERLASLGLIDAKKNLVRTTRQPSTPKKIDRTKKYANAAVFVTPSPSRSSRRLTHKPAQYEPLTEDNDVASLRISRKKFKDIKRATKTTSNFKCNVPMDVSSSPLSQEEKTLIWKKLEGDFLGKFEVSVKN